MLWILPRFGKIGVGILQHRVLIAVPKLLLQAEIAITGMLLSLGSTLRRILIARVVWHVVWHDQTTLFRMLSR
jgi:hypothetical protein